MGNINNKIWRYEYKRLFSGKIWIWISICFVINIILWFYTYKESEQNELYQDIVRQYEGVCDSEKINDVHSKTVHYSTVLNEHTIVSEKYAKDEISDIEYQQFISDYQYAKTYMNSWLKLQKNATRYEQQESSTYFFYEVSWEKLFDNNAQWIFTFLMVPLLVPYFYLDKDTQFSFIGRSYYKYRKIEKRRFIFALLVVLLFQIIWIAAELIVVTVQSSLPSANATACSLSACSGVKDSISLAGFYALENLLLLSKRCLDVFIMFLLARRGKSPMVTTVIILIYLLITNFYYIELLR